MCWSVDRNVVTRGSQELNPIFLLGVMVQYSLSVFPGILSSVSKCKFCLMTLCDPMDCSLPGSSVHGILQARILEWVAIPFCGGSSRPKDWNRVSCNAGRFLPFESPGKPRNFIEQNYCEQWELTVYSKSELWVCEHTFEIVYEKHITFSGC